MALKEDVLAVLTDARGDFVSGQALAQELKVTRSAVWKAVSALRAQGYEIRSVTNRGYALCAAPDLLRADEIAALLKPEGVDVLCFDTLDSTNAEARRRAETLLRPLLILADAQTAGRGRLGHTFYSPQRTGLYMTLALPVRLPLKDAALSTQAAAVAVSRAVLSLKGPALHVRGVNDLFYQGKKVGGILTQAIAEMESADATTLLCGIGLNLTTQDFPPALQPLAGGMGALPRAALSAQVVKTLLPLLSALPHAPWMPEYDALHIL